MLVEYCGLEFDLPNDWEDMTEEDNPPTLARPQGVGVIQFSFYSKTDGSITMDDLRYHLSDFGEGSGRTFEPLTERSGEISFVGGRSINEDGLFAAWMLTNGAQMVCMSYITGDPNAQAIEELHDAEHIASSMIF